MADPRIIQLQTGESQPQPPGLERATNLLLPPDRVRDRLAHFAEEVYDLTSESHLMRFLKVLLGDAGAGQLRKRMLFARLTQALHGTHFFDLDRFYGALFGAKRRTDERLALDPYTDTATSQEWQDEHAKDSSYRSRIMQFARALSFGGTPTGIELAAEALLSVDCDVYESYTQSDASYRTHGEIEEAYATYDAMDGVSYGELEGAALQRLSGNERREFIVRPKRQITLEESYDLLRVLNRIKPADTRCSIDWRGVEVHTALPISGVAADSEYWEVVPRISARPTAFGAPYPRPSADPVEQPRPPFSAYQGEAWSYNGDVAGVTAYHYVPGGTQPITTPAERILLADGSMLEFPDYEAVLPQRYVHAGRAVSDGVLVAHPYPGPRARWPSDYVDLQGQVWASVGAQRTALAPLYADRLPLGDLVDVLARSPDVDPFQQNPLQRMWATPERAQGDATQDVLEVRFTGARLINYLTFETAHFPHTAVAEVYDEQHGVWVEVYRRTLTDSVPQFMAPGEVAVGHPQHTAPGHWERCSARIDPVSATRFRIVLQRSEGEPPRLPRRYGIARSYEEARDLPYSLALRSIDLGYRVTSRKDIPSADVIGTTTDVLGSLVQFGVWEQGASGLLDGEAWRSEPQPVNYAVVNLHLDARDASGEGSVIDRFYLDPLHAGPHLSLYYSNDARYAGSGTGFIGGISGHGEQQVDHSAPPDAVTIHGATLVDNGYRCGPEARFSPSLVSLDIEPDQSWWVGLTLTADVPVRVPVSVPADPAVAEFVGLYDYDTGEFVYGLRAAGDFAAPLIPFDPTKGRVFFDGGSFSLLYQSGIFYYHFPWMTGVRAPYGPGFGVNMGEGETLALALRFNPAHRVMELVSRVSGDTTRSTSSSVMIANHLGAFDPPTDIAFGDVVESGLDGYTLGSFILRVSADWDTVWWDGQELFWIPNVYADAPEEYVRHPHSGYVPNEPGTPKTTPRLDNGATRLRFLPEYVVGRFAAYDQLVWTPIPRDYTLQRGYIHLPPTLGRYWKMEFTNLVAEPYEVMVPVTREVRLFPPGIVAVHGSRRAGVADEALPPGIAASIDIAGASRYRDAIQVLNELAQDDRRYEVTSALHSRNPAVRQRLHDVSWVYGFTPWSLGSDAPRFPQTQVHTYDTVEVRHTTKVGFFVGLNAVEAIRVDYRADDDAQVYVEHFWDAAHLQAGMTWNMDRNRLWNGSNTGATVTSRSFPSRHNVRAIQFATVQSSAVQIIPDHEFLDPALANSDWSDFDAWHKVGDARLFYSPSDNSVLMKRNVEAPLRTVEHVPGLPQPVFDPTFRQETFTVEDEEVEQALFGGIESPVVPLSSEGRVYAAVRFTLETDLTNPLVLQILSATSGIVLVEKEITGHKGEMIEEYVGYDISSFYVPPPAPVLYDNRSGIVDRSVQRPFTDPAPSATPAPPPLPPTDDSLVRARLIQRGKSDDLVRIDTLSLFDEGIIWEFSVNGGDDWYRAKGIRNNAQGVLVFPDPGNELMWRARAVRPNMNISSLRIRPWYVGVDNARDTGMQRGPNVSVFDHVPPIDADPEFTSWQKPIPQSWFYAARNLPRLNAVGAPDVTVFSRYYARAAGEPSIAAQDSSVRSTTVRRSITNAASPAGDSLTRTGVFRRTASEAIPTSDAARIVPVVPDVRGRIIAPPDHPV